MRSFIFYLMVVLMVVWTAVFIVELVYAYPSSPEPAADAGGFSLAALGAFYERVRADLWSIASGARIAVWALPMIVFAILSAVTQPSAR